MSFLAGYLFDQRLQTLSALSFDWSSISLGLLFGTGLALLGAIVDTLPIFKDITRDTRMFTLRLLGRDTSPLSALITASFLSVGAGVAEEAFFRGVIFTIVNSAIGLPGAFIISSAAFSLGHFPVWGANAINEFFLGGVFCYCYYVSGFNLVVPIVAHALYDLITIYTTWRSVSSDMKKRMSSAIQEGAPNLDKELSEYTTTQIENAITKAIFDVLDLDGDGTINPKELRVGFRLFGLGQPIFNTPGFSAKVDEIFQSMDVNKDGKITFKEFSESLRNEGILSFGTTKSGGNVSGKRA